MRDLRTHAHRLLLANLRRGAIPTAQGSQDFLYVCPSPAIYHHQWLWDSCFHAIVMARFDGALAQAELRTLLTQLRDDGFMPHVSNWLGFGRVPLSQRAARWLFGHGHHRRLTQPPVLALAFEEVLRHSGDLAFLQESLPVLKRYYGHLAVRRDPDGDGLLSIIFPDRIGHGSQPGV